jgi:hypothetical protein
MEICYVPASTLFLGRMLLFFSYLILFAIPSVSTTFQLSNRGHPHPHLSNASDQEALLGFMSAIRSYDTFQSLPTNWKPNVSFCGWTGIICSRRRQRVVSLNLSSMGLQEYGLGGHVTTKGDVYSYGIVLLETLTGKKPTHDMFAEGMNLQKWVGSSFPNRVGEVVDKNLLSTRNEEDKELNCLSELINVGLLCTKESPEGRPGMIDIVDILQSTKETFMGTTSNRQFQ